LIEQAVEQKQGRADAADQEAHRAAEPAAQDRHGALCDSPVTRGGHQDHRQRREAGDRDAAVEHQMRRGEEGVGSDVDVPLHVPDKTEQGQHHPQDEGDAGQQPQAVEVERPRAGRGDGRLWFRN
jgi:hypothetical protein